MVDIAFGPEPGQRPDTATRVGQYLVLDRRRRLYTGIILALFVAMLAAGFHAADARNAGGFWEGLHQLGDFPAEVLSEAWANRANLPGYLWQFLPSLIETVNIAAVSTLVGALLAMGLALLSSRGLAPWPLLTPVFRRIMDATRALPEVVIALMLIFILGGGPIPAMVAIALHTMGALGKLFSEAAENADLKPVEGLASVGAGWGQRMWLGVVPQVAPDWLSYSLQRFEINIRASAILGFVGSGGIGYDLKVAMQWGAGKYDQVVAIFLLLFATIVLVDQVSSHYRNRLVKGAQGGPTGDTTPGANGIGVRQLFNGKRRLALGIPVFVGLYLAYIVVAFDVAGVAQRARIDNAGILLSDFWSHKTHVTRDNRSGEVTIAIEGETKGTYGPGQSPGWVTREGEATTIDLGSGHVVTYSPGETRYEVPGYGTILMRSEGSRISLTAPEPLPDWISAADNRVGITTDQGRVSMTRNRTETFRYQPGWELFFFTLESPFYGKGPMELLSLATTGDRLDPARANVALMASEFWNNKMWHHRDVVGAIGETILMAFLGTFGGALVALPLAFLAASNLSPGRAVRFGMRRIFDFVRGVDALIWTIVLARAFGPGPLTGALAILITDAGSFGKQFSEALENIDTRQVEGIRSTGANALQRARFGVLPQLTPILLSQVLYSFESNTRSATVIGAIVGGGIGLLLTQAIITQKDWEEVAYYMVLIVLMVMAMDSLSGWLRRKLIKGGGA